ncbi:TspO/MBR family protein [Clostridium sp. YIM B02551]|uniref:TspO/MBR family protein n=1 Tax=Clostridium sp. YIM B02551 TaxID=2910679 RepID=UPI001EEBB6FD|nr:TspO/MBR family protein [Clostridium sp. YIM B02551]
MKNPFKVKGNFKISTFLIQVFMPLIGGALVGYLNRNTMGQYIELTKPFFAPPGIVFPIVWAILYLLMGVAAYRIYMLGMSGEDVSSAMFFYYIQLIFNYLWVFIFFSFRLYGLAFIELAILFVLVLITFIKFFRKDKLAGILLIPYLLWLIFAGVLNFYIWLLNEA